MAKVVKVSIKKEEKHDDVAESIRYDNQEDTDSKNGDPKWLRDLELKSAQEKTKVKTKDRGTLSADSIRARLTPIGLKPFPITLDRVTQGTLVSRAYLSETYGGNSQAMFPKVAEDKAKEHGIHHWGFMHLDYQPMAPQLPGAPGLVYSIAPGDLDRFVEPRHTFTRMNMSEWQYMGTYQLGPCEPLSREEWISLGPAVHKTWGREMAHKKWGTSVRCRIRARRDMGREPTEDERAAVMASMSYESITEDMIIAAYSGGEERLGVWTMKCVGYDASFQKGLSESYPPWNEERKRQMAGTKVGKGKKGKVAPTKVGKGKKKAGVPKRKRQDRESNEDEDEDDLSGAAFVSNFEAPEDGPRRKRAKQEPRLFGGGTRSRPRKCPTQVIDISD